VTALKAQAAATETAAATRAAATATAFNAAAVSTETALQANAAATKTTLQANGLATKTAVQANAAATESTLQANAAATLTAMANQPVPPQVQTQPFTIQISQGQLTECSTIVLSAVATGYPNSSDLQAQWQFNDGSNGSNGWQDVNDSNYTFAYDNAASNGGTAALTLQPTLGTNSYRYRAVFTYTGTNGPESDPTLGGTVTQPIQVQIT